MCQACRTGCGCHGSRKKNWPRGSRELSLKSAVIRTGRLAMADWKRGPRGKVLAEARSWNRLAGGSPSSWRPPPVRPGHEKKWTGSGAAKSAPDRRREELVRRAPSQSTSKNAVFVEMYDANAFDYDDEEDEDDDNSPPLE